MPSLHDSLNYDLTCPHPRTRAQRFVIWLYFGGKPYRGPMQVLAGLVRGSLIQGTVLAAIPLWFTYG